MRGRTLVILLAAAALVAGAAMYWLQVHAYYDEVPASGAGDVAVTTVAGGAPEAILYDNFRAIDADSSPLRYRACFDTGLSTAMMSETYVIYDRAVPTVAPGWFDCFDAAAIGGMLERGEALAFLGTRNLEYGIDRVVAVDDDGRGWVWHQINDCGAKVFDGEPAPEGCPPPPERTN